LYFGLIYFFADEMCCFLKKNVLKEFKLKDS